jgi:hypothetical protein
LTEIRAQNGRLPIGGLHAGPRALVIDAPSLRQLPLACRTRMMPAPRPLSGLTRAWMDEVRLPAVVFALFATAPDAWSITAHLTAIGYRGRVFALAPPLPNRAMVERELRAECPDLRLRVLTVLPADGGNGLHSQRDRQ